METYNLGRKNGILVLVPTSLQELRDYGLKNLGWEESEFLEPSLRDDVIKALDYESHTIELETNSRIHIDFSNCKEFQALQNG